MTPSQFQTWLEAEVSQHLSVTSVVRQQIQVPCNCLTYQALLPSGLGNYIVCKRFKVQTLLQSLKFGIQINIGHNTIAIYINKLYVDNKLYMVVFVIHGHSLWLSCTISKSLESKENIKSFLKTIFFYYSGLFTLRQVGRQVYFTIKNIYKYKNI